MHIQQLDLANLTEQQTNIANMSVDLYEQQANLANLSADLSEQ